MKKRIVIVEDNKAISEGFAAVINLSADFQVVGQYLRCEDAIERISIDAPDLVLMDIDLPGMDGIRGTAQLKKLVPECIVLIITVFEDGDKVFRSLCAGAGGYIVKNSAGEDIVRSISEALLGGAPMSLQIARLVVAYFQPQSASPLSKREREVLQGISEGKSYTKIALDLFISKETVRTHIKNIYQKLAVNSKAEALKVAGNNRWLS